MDKKFEVGQFWKDNQDDKHLICDIDDAFIYTFCFADKEKYEWNLDGSIADGDIYVFTLTELWQEPRSGFVWVNVHHTEFHEHYEYYSYDSLEAATENAEPHLIARIKMPWKEGQFDE